MAKEKRIHIESLNGRMVLDSLNYDNRDIIRELFNYKLGPEGHSPSYWVGFDKDFALVSLEEGYALSYLYCGRTPVVQLEAIIGNPHPEIGIWAQKGGLLSKWNYIVMFNFPTSMADNQPFKDKKDGLEKIAKVCLCTEQALIAEGVREVYGDTHSSVAYLLEEMGHTLIPEQNPENLPQKRRGFKFVKQISQEKLRIPRILR